MQRIGFNPIDILDPHPVRTTQQLSITLPREMAEAIKAKVSQGEYASESEVIRDGLRVLLARDRAVEQWLVAEVRASYDALQADPSQALSAADVRAKLQAEHEIESAKAR